MARDRGNSDDYVRPIRRILIGGLVLSLLALFLLWRIDSPRAERLRAQVIDRIVPSFEWALVPLTKVGVKPVAVWVPLARGHPGPRKASSGVHRRAPRRR